MKGKKAQKFWDFFDRYGLWAFVLIGFGLMIYAMIFQTEGFTLFPLVFSLAIVFLAFAATYFITVSIRHSILHPTPRKRRRTFRDLAILSRSFLILLLISGIGLYTCRSIMAYVVSLFGMAFSLFFILHSLIFIEMDRRTSENNDSANQ